MNRKIDRLDKFAEYKNLTDNQITAIAGLSVGTINKSRKPDKDLTRRSSEAILDAFPELNRDWLLYGNGEMIAAPQREPAERCYPLIDYVAAECGKTFGDMQGAMAEDLPLVSIPGVPPTTEFFVRASGYSMVNETRTELSIPPGSLVGLSRLNGGLIRWGEPYALATTDGIMIKRVLQDPDNPEMLRCASYNSQEYPEFSIERNEVIDLARITCVVPIYVR